MSAACRVVRRLGARQLYVNFVIELTNLNGRKAFDEGTEITTLLPL